MAGKIEYPKDYNPILEYWKEIESGAVTVSRKVYKTYEKLVWDVEHPGKPYTGIYRKLLPPVKSEVRRQAREAGTVGEGNARGGFWLY